MESIPKAQLYFSIADGFVWGTAGGKKFGRMRAFSGGGGGSTAGRADPKVVNNPGETDRKTDRANNVRGGPLPVHKYAVDPPERHPNLGMAARLTPLNGGDGMYGRSGFYFHGRGKMGSDGCIVFEDPTHFQNVMKALKISRGGTLTVLSGRH